MTSLVENELTLAQAITFTRASIANAFDYVDGLFFEAAANQPRYESNGLLLEASSENLVLQSRDLANAAWTSSGTISRSRNMIGIDGVSNAATDVLDSDSGVASYLYQTITISPTDQFNTASCFFGKTVSATYPGFALEYGANVSFFTINTLTGEAIEMAGDGTCSVRSYGDFWRVSIALRNTGSSSSATLKIYPRAGSGTSTTVVSNTGSTIVDAVQFEVACTVASSPIYTTTTAITRAAESAVNTGFATWGRQAAFTIYVEIDRFALSALGGDILSLYSGSINRIRILGSQSSGGSIQIISAMDTGGYRTKTFALASSAKIAVSSEGIDGGNVIKSVNGTSLLSGLTSAPYTDIATLGLGRGISSGTPPATLTIKKLKFWPTAMTESELNAMTSS